MTEAQFIADHGVTRCPTAFIAPTANVELADKDREALHLRWKSAEEKRKTLIANWFL